MSSPQRQSLSQRPLPSPPAPSFYMDAASFGRVVSYISGAIGVLMGLAMIVVGMRARRNIPTYHLIPPPNKLLPVSPLLPLSDPESNRAAGGFLMFIGLVVISLSIFMTWLAQKYQFVAAIQGISVGLSLFRFFL
jgi:hypothetical protein